MGNLISSGPKPKTQGELLQEYQVLNSTDQNSLLSQTELFILQYNLEKIESWEKKIADKERKNNDDRDKAKELFQGLLSPFLGHFEFPFELSFSDAIRQSSRPGRTYRGAELNRSV